MTGAEFAGAYQSLGSQVTLVSSRDRMMPNEDADGAEVLEEVYRRRGMNVMGRSRAASVKRTADGVVVTLEDGRTAEGSHCLMTVGMVPNTAGIGLEDNGVRLDRGGFIEVDKVSRTSAPGIYAAGDCTGVLMLASVAAMQGRIAVWHALGEAVQPSGWPRSPPTSSPTRRSPTSGCRSSRSSPARSTPTSSNCPWRPTRGPRCRGSTTGS